MFDGRWRGAVDRSTGPVGQRLHRWGVTADVLTATGLVSATATAVAVGTGHLHLAVILLILTGLHDLLDGPVAKASGTSSVRGAFFDSVTDRVADALILGGVAWYLVSTHPGHLVLPAVRRARRHLAGLLSAGQGRIARHLRPGRSDGTGRADDPARRRLPVGHVPGSRALGHAGPHHGHRRGTVRQGVAVGRGPGSGGLPPAPPPVPERQHAPAIGRPSASPSRWRARRQGELSSRSGRTWRARHARQGIRQRTGRRHT